jgi:hypothetical protein
MDLGVVVLKPCILDSLASGLVYKSWIQGRAVSTNASQNCNSLLVAILDELPETSFLI